MKAGLVLIRANLPPHTDLQPFFTWFVSMLIKFLVKATREAFSGKRMYASFCFLFQFKIFFFILGQSEITPHIHLKIGLSSHCGRLSLQPSQKWWFWASNREVERLTYSKNKTSCFEFRTSSKKDAWLCLFWSDRVGMVTETKHELIGWKVFFITLEGTLI